MRAEAIALLVSLLSLGACMPRARMCTATRECDAKSACVAGRCQRDAATVKPAVDSARRIVVRPVDLAYLREGDGPSGGALPPVFALGTGGGKLLLRFSASVPPAATIVEAYVVLHRSRVVDDDPAPLSLHATRIVESWAGGSVSWAIQPRATESRAPSTTVEPGGSGVVRLDVRELVRHWGRHDPLDHGIAIVADTESRSGTTFALSGVGAEREAADVGSIFGRGMSVAPSSSALVVEPYLELYVR